MKRGLQPQAPDAYLLRDAITVLIDCGLRPEECYRLRWDNLRDGAIVIHTGKGKGSRRRVPASARALAFLEMRKGTGQQDGWIFAAPTKSGHIETSSLKKLHTRALTLSGVTPFVLYDLRHTCLTRWAKGMDSLMLKKLAGHTSLATTARYVHLNDADVRAAMDRARAADKPAQPAAQDRP